MSKSRIKGIYLIQEEGCLNPYSGAFQHISMGVEQLSQHFELDTYLGIKRISLSKFKKIGSNKETVSRSKKKKKALYGTLKDLLILFKNLKNVLSLIKCIKGKKVDFVYERASYLNFSGLIACKYLGIPHFYEANGLQFQSRKKYYKSYFYKIAKTLEKSSYKYATHTFFVGSYGNYWNIKKSNWTNVENGIEAQNILKINEKELDTEIIDICFVGRFMKHQRLDILIDGLKMYENKKLLRVNLIGTGLEGVETEIRKLCIDVVNYGFVSRSDIVNLLHNFPIAIIAGSPEYQSCMKLFDYGAAGCAVIAPKIYNLKYWFKNEIIFFDGSTFDFSQKLDLLLENDELRKKYSVKMQQKILREFTWEIIFKKKVEVIEKAMRNEGN
jgi:glycosyltransferase involved in cell wall biosynthesis